MMFGTVTARNYAMQCVGGLLEYSRDMKALGKAHDAGGAALFAGILAQAEHFAIPDIGRVLDDKLAGLCGQDLHIPYELVSVEFYVPFIPEKLTGRTPTYSPKRVVLLMEATREEIDHRRKTSPGYIRGGVHPLPDLSRLKGDRFIIAWVACYIDRWRPMAATWAFQVVDWDAREQGEGFEAVRGEMGCLMPDYLEDLIRRHGIQEARETIMIDIQPELRTALEFMEAMSCSNIIAITHEPGAPAAVNERRKRNNKLPIHETKTLTIDPRWLESYSQRQAARGGAKRASPKQHLRRGHLWHKQWRERGERPIWIPSMVVGDPERGSVVKDYKVRA